jgi:TctA family transporter
MDGVLAGLSMLGTSAYWFAFFAAVSMAAFAGLVPGASASLLMALAIPFIVFNVHDPVIGIVMLATITSVDDMLDVLPIVALGHPGGGQVTFLEARPLVSKGHAARVLGFIYTVSAIGGLIGAVVLLLVMPIIKPFILQFSFAEIAALGIFGVAVVGALSRGAMVKGLTMGLVGLLLSTVGVSPFSGEARFTLGLLEFQEGLPLIATVIGLFALPEMIDLLMTRSAVSRADAKFSTREVFRGAGLALKYWKLIIRHSILGVFLGAIPGVGARVVSWLSYGIGISTTKNRRQFGRGSYRGLVFSESVQSAKEGGQAIPTLALGIPGGQGWVFVLVAMIAYGISPGPSLLSQHGDIVTLIVVSLILGNVVLAALGMFASGQLAKLSRVPYPVLGAVIIPLSILSAFQETQYWTAIPLILSFAALGLVMKNFKWPRPPLILGFILGEIIEKNGMSAISLYGLGGTLSRPLTIVLLILAVVVVVFFIRIGSYEKRVPQLAAAASVGAAAVDETPHKNAWVWRKDSYVGLLFILIGAAFMWQSLDYRPVARNFPFVLGALIIVLSVVQLIKSGWERGESEVLDIGMLSNDAVGQRRSAIILFGYFIAFVILAYVIGLQYAAILFAATIPAAFMIGRRPWAWGFLTGGILVLLVFGLFDNLINIIWPNSLLSGFFE